MDEELHETTGDLSGASLDGGKAYPLFISTLCWLNNAHIHCINIEAASLSLLGKYTVKGDVEGIDRVASAGIDINEEIKGKKYNALHIASWRGPLCSASALLDLGTDIERGATSKKGCTQLESGRW